MIRVHRLTLILQQTVGELVSRRDLSAGHNHPASKQALTYNIEVLSNPESLPKPLILPQHRRTSQTERSRPLCASTLLLSSAFLFIYFTFSLFICLLHPRIHIETIRFRSNSLLEKTSGRYGNRPPSR